MIDPRAIERTLAEGIDVRMLFDHDPGRPLGRLSAGTLKLIPTSRSLNFEVEPPEHEAGVMASVERRDIDGASFGFVVLRDEWTMANGQARRLASRLPPVVPIIRGSAREGPPAAGALQINRLEQRPRPAALVVRVGPCRSGARCTASAQYPLCVAGRCACGRPRARATGAGATARRERLATLLRPAR